MVHFRGAFIVLVCWILVLEKNTHQLCFVHLVLICKMHPNKYGESFRFFCILLLHLDVLRCNLKIELFFAVSVVDLVCTAASDFNDVVPHERRRIVNPQRGEI